MLAEITAAMTIMMHRNTLLPHLLLFAFNVKGHYLLFSIAACLLKFFLKMRLESIARLCAACILGDKKKSALGWLIFYFQRSHNHNTQAATRGITIALR
jgi:hypothetical protein